MYTCVYMDLKPSERPIASVLRMPIGDWRLSAGMYPVARSRSSALFWAVIALRYGWGSTDSVDMGRVALSHPSRSSRLLTGPVDEWPSDPHAHVTRGVYDSCMLLRKACQGCYYVLAGLAPSCGPVQRPDVVLLERHAPGSALSVGGLASQDARVSAALGLYYC